MDGGILSRIFGDTAQKHGVGVALVVVFLFGIFMIALYAAKVRVDLWRQEAVDAARERQDRERERANEKQQLIQAINAARVQNLEIMQESYRRSDALVQTVTDVASEAHAIASALQSHQNEITVVLGRMATDMAIIKERPFRPA